MDAHEDVRENYAALPAIVAAAVGVDSLLLLMFLLAVVVAVFFLILQDLC